MFWKNEPFALYRKGKALVVAFIASVLISIASIVLSLRGSFEATIAAMVAIVAAAATGNWAHWAFKDAKKLAREIHCASTRATADSAGVGAKPRSARPRGVRVLPQNRRIAAFSERSSTRVRRPAALGGDHS
jgi:hypothetical protein